MHGRVVRSVGQRGLQHALGVGQCVLRQGEIGRLPIIAERPGGIARLRVMRRQLTGHRLQVAGVQGLERTGHRAVKQAAARPARLQIGDLTDAVVAEVIAVIRLLAHQTPLPQFIQRIDQHQFVDRHGGSQHGIGKLAPDDCGGAGNLLRRR